MNHPLTYHYEDSWRDDVLRGADHFGETKVVVMTYAKFGTIVYNHAEFGDTFKYILCDELHSLPRFSQFQESNPLAIKSHEIAWNRLTSIINQGKVIVIGLSATPKRIQENKSYKTNIIPIDDDIRRYETKNTLYYCDIDTVLERLPKDKKILLYIGHITKMEEIEDKAKKSGFNPISIWSTHSATHPMTLKQLDARDYILRYEKLPEEYNLVIINASCETSINLKGKIDIIVIHSQREEAQVQVRGRYRGDLDTLYLLKYEAIIDVPPEFLGKKLFSDRKEALCGALKLRNKQGRIVGWPSVKKALIENGYYVKEGRCKNERYVVIENTNCQF